MRKLWKGNEAVAEAAIAAGCRCFFGYPITPQNEIPEYMSRRMGEVGGAFVQAESEVAAINMVYGAGGAGARAMTSSSSPGISLKQEGISYIAGAQVPCVIVNMMRAGPGLGGIQPSQSDYFQATKGGGHGDYHMLVYAPSGVQEAADLTYKAFDKADKYRSPVMILGDGMLGQMCEAAEIPPARELKDLPEKPWAASGNGGRAQRIINSIYMSPDTLEAHNKELFDVYAEMEKETAWEEYKVSDAEVIVVAYGTVARIAKAAVDKAVDNGGKVGLLRPITLYPFPSKAVASLADKNSTKCILTVELSMGQMVEDVRLAVNGRKPTPFFGRTGGNVTTPQEILNRIIAEGSACKAKSILEIAKG
jgi:2-oxoglutarate ferredoxin oxidoreductase subunit alpha